MSVPGTESEAVYSASGSDLEFVKEEILFFMDKIFQFSFAYVAAVLAALASIKFDVLKSVGDLFGFKPQYMFATLVLIVNFVYLVLASSCQFGVVKRGYFILRRAAPGIELARWEEFLRGKTSHFSMISWNADNLFGVVFYLLVACSSAALFCFGWSHGTYAQRGFLWVVIAAHALPLWALYQLLRLNQVIDIERRKRASPSMSGTSATPGKGV